MTVVGAAFASESAAIAAEHELTDRLGLDPSAMQLAPLGAVGRLTEARLIVAAHVPDAVVPEATQIIVKHGGEIVTEVTRANSTGVDRPEAGAPTGPDDALRSEPSVASGGERPPARTGSGSPPPA